MERAQKALSRLATLSAGLGLGAWFLSESLYNGQSPDWRQRFQQAAICGRVVHSNWPGSMSGPVQIRCYRHQRPRLCLFGLLARVAAVALSAKRPCNRHLLSNTQNCVSVVAELKGAAFGTRYSAAVDGGHRAVIWNRFAGGIQDKVVGEGTHFRIPLISYPTIFDVRTHLPTHRA